MPTKSCPLCGKPPLPDHAPFCSRGCKDRDLLKWLGEGYAIPGPPAHSDGLDADGQDADRLDPDRLDPDRLDRDESGG